MIIEIIRLISNTKRSHLICFICLCYRTFLYLAFILLLGATCTRSALQNDFMIAAKVSAIRVMLLAGLYVSSMSSCLGAMYGTPRVLQSIANENVIPGIGILEKGVSRPL